MTIPKSCNTFTFQLNTIISGQTCSWKQSQKNTLKVGDRLYLAGQLGKNLKLAKTHILSFLGMLYLCLKTVKEQTLLPIL